MPDIKGREQILKVHGGKVPLAEDVNINDLARGTPGFSGAELANLINEGALFAARNNQAGGHHERSRQSARQNDYGRGKTHHDHEPGRFVDDRLS